MAIWVNSSWGEEYPDDHKWGYSDCQCTTCTSIVNRVKRPIPKEPSERHIIRYTPGDWFPKGMKNGNTD